VTANFFGFEHRTFAPITLARTMWLRGVSDQARALAKGAIDSLTRADPLSICVALTFTSPVFLWSGGFPTASDYAARLIEYAGRHSLEVYRACGHGLKGAVAIARGRIPRLIRHGSLY
jgi:hypothetical protein